MVESLGFAGVSETPLVIVNAQRPGPATGLPTRTEQSDLRFVLHASQGEFPRVILAPGTPREAFYLTIKAFHLAYKYQLPVLILTDQYLADSFFTEDKFDNLPGEIDTFFPTGEELSGQKNYLRYRFTETGYLPVYHPPWRVMKVFVTVTSILRTATLLKIHLSERKWWKSDSKNWKVLQKS